MILIAGFACGAFAGAAYVDSAAAANVSADTVTAASLGNADSGKLIYARCAACHSLTSDRTGPRHCGLLGRRAGSLAGFDFSAAMRSSGIVWTTATLDRFLADPLKAVPGTAMGYGGVTDNRERADLVAFLARESSSAQCRH
jgi:cytochrome c